MNDNTQLATVQSFQEMQTMAKLFAESNMFPDMKTMGMAFVKIQAGKEIGISPFAAMSGIHIIQGKAAIGAGLMAGCVKGSPKYDYKVVQMDEKICSIDFLMKGGAKLGNSTFTIEDAKKAQTKNLDKFPKNMLFARAMSNGVKWFCPDVFTMPVYTPEEMGSANFTEDIAHEEITTPATPTIAKKKLAPASLKLIIERIVNGETGLPAKTKEAFELTAAQVKELDEAKAKPSLNELEFASAVDEVSKGTQTAAGVIAAFLLTKEQSDTLIAIVPTPSA